MEELLAAVILLDSETALQRWSGRGAQAWLLDNIRRIDPALARKLHETSGKSNRRPYTVSVMPSQAVSYLERQSGESGTDKNESVGNPRAPDVFHGLSEPSGSDNTHYRNKSILRVTSLSADLTAALGENVFPNIRTEGVIWLNGVEAQVKSIQTDEHPWSGNSSFEGLAQKTLISPEISDQMHDTLAWEFATPTAFHQNGLTMPLPLPGLVFGSLIQAWDHFSPLPLPVVLGSFVEQNVGISRHRLATRLVKFGSKEQHIGFVGTTDYRIVPEHSELPSSDFVQRVRLLAMLSQFAFFAGVGIRTTVGMGQTRVNIY